MTSTQRELVTVCAAQEGLAGLPLVLVLGATIAVLICGGTNGAGSALGRVCGVALLALGLARRRAGRS